MATVSRRYNELSDLSVRELANRLEFYEKVNAGLRRLLVCALGQELKICGDIIDPTTSCQLPCGHEGCHTWMAHDGSLIVQWG